MYGLAVPFLFLIGFVYDYSMLFASFRYGVVRIFISLFDDLVLKAEIVVVF